MKKNQPIFGTLVWKTYFLIILLLTACDEGFEEMNQNPNVYNNPVIESMFSYSIVRTAGTGDDRDWGNGMYAGGIMQYFASLDTHMSGEKYLYNAAYNDGFFLIGYRSHLKEIEQVIALIKDDPALTNQYAIARIWRVYAYHRLTDLYGDIPYSEAGLGYLAGTYKPKYDRQADIYADMLNELEEAALLLDPSETSFGAGDFLYSGDVTQWKRFAYSMMLRLGMRLTKVDPGMAETYVKKAIAGGVMQSNEDIARLDHTDGPTGNNWNWDSYWQHREEIPPSVQGNGTSKLSDTFVNMLKDSNDPRLPFYATLWQGNADPTQLPASSAPEKQKGLPNGYDFTSIKTAIPGWTDAMYAEYSEINLHTIASMAAPTIFQSYAEVEFLLAEAALRSWDGGDAKTHYEKGIRAAMEMVTLYPGEVSISSDAIDNYLTANPFVTGSMDQQMEQIHNQYWIIHFFTDNIEGYANWRRTGFPTLTPVNYPGNETGGVIPRRLRYPQSEAILNTEAYNTAVQVQGTDLYTTRVWWDKE